MPPKPVGARGASWRYLQRCLKPANLRSCGAHCGLHSGAIANVVGASCAEGVARMCPWRSRATLFASEFSGDIRTVNTFSGDIWTLGILQTSESRPKMRCVSDLRPEALPVSGSSPTTRCASETRPLMRWRPNLARQPRSRSKPAR